jgi:hypothetical protein
MVKMCLSLWSVRCVKPRGRIWDCEDKKWYDIAVGYRTYVELQSDIKVLNVFQGALENDVE